ncbi:MAG: hypothetical protein AAF346_24215, partial [Pseudomonadota bacterium]
MKIPQVAFLLFWTAFAISFLAAPAPTGFFVDVTSALADDGDGDGDDGDGDGDGGDGGSGGGGSGGSGGGGPGGSIGGGGPGTSNFPFFQSTPNYRRRARNIRRRRARAAA